MPSVLEQAERYFLSRPADKPRGRRAGRRNVGQSETAATGRQAPVTTGPEVTVTEAVGSTKVAAHKAFEPETESVLSVTTSGAHVASVAAAVVPETAELEAVVHAADVPAAAASESVRPTATASTAAELPPINAYAAAENEAALPTPVMSATDVPLTRDRGGSMLADIHVPPTEMSQDLQATPGRDMVTFPKLQSRPQHRSHPSLAPRAHTRDLAAPRQVGDSLPANLDLLGIGSRSQSDLVTVYERLDIAVNPVDMAKRKRSNSKRPKRIEVEHEPLPPTEVELAVAEEFRQEMKRAEEEIQHNWVLAVQLERMNRNFEKRKRDLDISHTVSDDAAEVVITKRLNEVRAMSHKKRDERYVLDRIDPEARERILVRKYTYLAVQDLVRYNCSIQIDFYVCTYCTCLQ